MEAVIIGDTHLDALTGLYSNARSLMIDEIRKPLQYATKNNIRNVFFLGDISHKHTMSYEAHLLFMELLDEYDKKLQIHIILGNHDIRSEHEHSLQILEKLCKRGRYSTVHIHSSPAKETIDDIPVNFLPYPHVRAESSVDALNIAHFTWHGAKADNGKRMEGVEGDEGIYIIGHMHTRQKIGSRVFYPGTLYHTSFPPVGSEPPPKGFAHIKVEKEGKKLQHKMKFIKNKPAFNLHSVRVESEDDLEKIESGELDRYRLHVSKKVDIPPSYLKDRPNIVNAMHLGAKLSPGKIEDDLQSVNLKEEIEKDLRDQGADDEQVDTAMRILRESEIGLGL